MRRLLCVAGDLRFSTVMRNLGLLGGILLGLVIVTCDAADDHSGPALAEAGEEAERSAQARFDGRPAQRESFTGSGRRPGAGTVRPSPRPGIGEC